MEDRKSVLFVEYINRFVVILPVGLEDRNIFWA